MNHAPTHPLRSGYTTGACAAAAAKGAALMLVRQSPIDQVTIHLPGGSPATFQLQGQSFDRTSASCFVVKDAGDDPDITNGVEVHAEVAYGDQGTGNGDREDIKIIGGVGIGRVTKPGLAVPPGEWAINPVPRAMIEQAVTEVLSQLPGPWSPNPGDRSLVPDPRSPVPILVTISIPDGEERAQKTLNARLGIIGGLSILGTTGIVRPISAKAWTDTIDAALDVARACGCRTVVLSTGRTSEMAVQRWLGTGDQGSGTGQTRDQGPETGDREQKSENHEQRTLNHEPLSINHEQLPEEAYIMMGDHVAYCLQACQRRGFDRPVIACQFAKLLKIACGHANTHAAASELDLATLRGWAKDAGLPGGILDLISKANTAREIAVASGFDPALMRLVADRAVQAAALHAPGITVTPLLCTYDGGIIPLADPPGTVGSRQHPG